MEAKDIAIIVVACSVLVGAVVIILKSFMKSLVSLPKQVDKMEKDVESIKESHKKQDAINNEVRDKINDLLVSVSKTEGEVQQSIANQLQTANKSFITKDVFEEFRLSVDNLSAILKSHVENDKRYVSLIEKIISIEKK